MATKTNTAHQTAVERLRELAKRGSLIAVFGTGSSVTLTNSGAPTTSWTGLIESGFGYGSDKGLITSTQCENWKSQLHSSDIDDVLSAAEFVGRKLGAPNGALYARWLENSFAGLSAKNTAMANAVRALQSAGIPICTLNYDMLLEGVTGLDGITFQNTNRVGA